MINKISKQFLEYLDYCKTLGHIFDNNLLINYLAHFKNASIEAEESQGFIELCKQKQIQQEVNI